MNRQHKTTLGLIILVLLLSVADLLTGDSYIAPQEVLRALFQPKSADPVTVNIICSIRLIRVGVAILIGAALAVSGLQMQTVFRNPLADPYLLGVSSGAGLGVALFILGVPLLGIHLSHFWQSVGVVGAGWIGAAVVLLLVAVISRRIRNILGVLIIGVMLGYVAGALIQIMQYMSSAEQLKMFVIWSLGSLGHVTMSRLFIMGLVLLIGFTMAFSSVKALNLLLLGESYARTMGLRIGRSRTVIFVSTTLLAGTVTAFCGPIGFLGLAVPHIARYLYKEADHRVLLPGSLLIGIVAMLICDIVAKSLVLPINSITALLGVPVILRVVAANLKQV